MIRRSHILSIDENKNPWMCVKCNQKRLLIYDTNQVFKDEIAHLEGKIPSFEYKGEILQIDPKTRQYKTIGKIED